MQRRALLQTTLAGLVLPGSGRLFAAPAAGSRLLLVFLRGGYDAMSLLVPASSSFYREARPNIAVAGALPLTADWALHPALRNSIAPLVARRQACFVPFAGSDDVSRSHFETQDTIELGQPLQGRRDFGSGFMNRLAAQLQGRDAIAFTDQLPLAMRGSVQVANQSLKNLPPAADGRLQPALAGMYRGTALQANVDEAFTVRADVAREVARETAREAARETAMAASASAEMAGGKAAEMQAASRNAVDTRGFELEARRIAALMRERYALGFVDVGGWDTHVGQGNATGTLATRLEELGRGLTAFADALGDAAWRDTVVVVVSEFGRTLRENGNRGTDHGHGSVYWVLGGALAAGPVAGEQQAVAARTLFQNRDLPVLNEVRPLLGGLLRRQFALSDAQIDTIFPGSRPVDIGLL